MTTFTPDSQEAETRALSLDDRAGPAKRISRDQSLAMIERALTTWEHEQPARARPGALWKSVAAASAILFALAGGASAARWYYGTQLETVEITASRAPVPKARRAPPVIAPLEASHEAHDVVEQAAPEARPRKVATHEKAEPDDLLQRANRLRAEGRFQPAAETYTVVYERYPRSLAAYVAQVAAGSIELEHLGRANRARKLFESALRSQPRGALDLEARQGLALALRDLGRNEEEAAALRALIRFHAQSPASRRAEARLQELSESAQ